MESIKVTLQSVTALLMHSDRYSNPLDPLTKRHKELTGKRKKTDEDQEAILFSEWRGALYFDEKIGPFIPGVNIESMLMTAAKLQKLGSKFKQAVMVMEDKVKIEYSGPRNIDGLYANGFVDVRSVKVQQARIQRCRPVFPDWGCEFTISFNEAVVDRRDVLKALDDAGKLIGLGDFRPRYGKFEVAAK